MHFEYSLLFSALSLWSFISAQAATTRDSATPSSAVDNTSPNGGIVDPDSGRSSVASAFASASSPATLDAGMNALIDPNAVKVSSATTNQESATSTTIIGAAQEALGSPTASTLLTETSLASSAKTSATQTSPASRAVAAAQATASTLTEAAQNPLLNPASTMIASSQSSTMPTASVSTSTSQAASNAAAGTFQSSEVRTALVLLLTTVLTIYL